MRDGAHLRSLRFDLVSDKARAQGGVLIFVTTKHEAKAIPGRYLGTGGSYFSNNFSMY